MDNLNNAQKKQQLRTILANTKIKLSQNNNTLSGLGLSKFIQKRYIKNATDTFVKNNTTSANLKLVNAIKTLIDKLKMKTNQNTFTVFIHPLLPIEVTKYLEKQGFRVIVFQIDKNTLDLDLSSFNKIVGNNPNSLVIHYSITGNAKYLEKMILESEISVKHIVVDATGNIDNFTPIIDSKIVFGFISNINPSPIKLTLKELVNVEFGETSLWLTIIPTESLLDIVKIAPSNVSQKILEIVDFLLQLSFDPNQKEIKSSVSDFIFQKRVEITKSKDIEKTKAELINLMTENDEVGLDSFWFELVDISKYIFGLNGSNYINKAENLLNLINSINENKVDTSLLIPDLLESGVFYFYTQEINWWFNELSSHGYNFYQLPSALKQGISAIDSNYTNIQQTCLITNI
jgi:hypothetical protein